MRISAGNRRFFWLMLLLLLRPLHLSVAAAAAAAEKIPVFLFLNSLSLSLSLVEQQPLYFVLSLFRGHTLFTYPPDRCPENREGSQLYSALFYSGLLYDYRGKRAINIHFL